MKPRANPFRLLLHPDGSGDWFRTATMAWKRLYRPDELSRVNCPVCGSNVSRRVASEFGIAVDRCLGCEVVFTRTPLHDSQRHYSASASAVRNKYEDVARGLVPHNRTRNYHEHLAILEARTSGRALLDVGAHCGFFLDVARQRGWQVTGVEPSRAACDLAREWFGLEVLCGTLSEVDLADARFDVVTLVDVFEHIGKPLEMLRHIRSLLRSDGILFIKVPNARYVLSKSRLLAPLGILDDVFDAREHLVFYSSKTLRQTLAMADFEVIDTRVPLPVQGGPRWRRLLRASGPYIASRLPNGHTLPLATDLDVIASPLHEPRGQSRHGAGTAVCDS